MSIIQGMDTYVADEGYVWWYSGGLMCGPLDMIDRFDRAEPWPVVRVPLYSYERFISKDEAYMLCLAFNARKALGDDA